MNAIKKERLAAKDFDELKVRLKIAWKKDCAPSSRYVENDAHRFSWRPGAPTGNRLLDVGRGSAPNLILRAENSSFGSMARSPAESQAETARFNKKLRQKEFNEEKLWSLVTRLRLNALTCQLNPHFFCNALNTIGVLIEENPAEARRLTVKMASIFRQTLWASDREMVSLEEELSFIQDYLEIEKARFGERLRVEQTVLVNNVEIPCFTLQLLVENAIKHGASRKVGTTTIRILALQEGDRVQIRVSDDGVGMSKDALNHILEKGYGLRNLIDRLNILYGSEFSCQVESEFQKGTVVSLQLPSFPVSEYSGPATDHRY
jgi:LytS/YehU family sensor histidine kinase